MTPIENSAPGLELHDLGDGQSDIILTSTKERKGIARLKPGRIEHRVPSDVARSIFDTLCAIEGTNMFERRREALSRLLRNTQPVSEEARWDFQ